METTILDRLSVLTDEVSPRFSDALDWAAREKFHHVEVRMVDGINVTNLSDTQAAAAAREVGRRGLSVSALASPLFKCALDPSRPVATGDLFGNKQESLAVHFEKLERTLHLARIFRTDRIRIFSFWREADPRRHEEEIAVHLSRAARIADGRALLLLENENSCNGGYAEEVARIVHRVNSPTALRVLWDPGNENYGGRSAFPEGYAHVKDLLAHVHLKDVVLNPDGSPRCLPIGSGSVPYRDQLLALERDGYRGLYTLETHYTPPGGTPMAGTEESLAGLRALLLR